MNGTYKAGDVITLEASFTGPVKVTGTPRLSLKYSSDDSNPKYAVYSAGSGTDTLKFTYKVPSGASSPSSTGRLSPCLPWICRQS